MEAHGADGSGDAILSPSPGLPSRPERKSTFQTLRREVHSPGGSMCLGHCSLPQEPVCCECQVKFQGHWPVPRAEAALPYWVPLSLRPQKQIPRMVQFCIPKATKTCACPCHHFGGRLPLPRTKAVMPYWVPRGLRSQRKVVRKQRNLKALQAVSTTRGSFPVSQGAAAARLSALLGWAGSAVFQLQAPQLEVWCACMRVTMSVYRDRGMAHIPTYDLPCAHPPFTVCWTLRAVLRCMLTASL
ncbi:hypothetical protein H1C71_039836 [Ictidomys tridecemlineatus]|nr:hypothetical protein H1C71_039836 [Ictidomys tridecemlineatus]